MKILISSVDKFINESLIIDYYEVGPHLVKRYFKRCMLFPEYLTHCFRLL